MYVYTQKLIKQLQHHATEAKISMDKSIQQQVNKIFFYMHIQQYQMFLY